MLQQAAQPGVMNLLGGGRFAVALRDFRIVENGFHEGAQMRIGHGGDDGAQLAPHFAGIASGRGEIVREIDFAVLETAHFVNRELRTVVIDLDESLHLHEVVAIEGVHHFGDVVPHLGFDLAGSIAEAQGKIRLSGFLFANLFGADQEATW